MKNKIKIKIFFFLFFVFIVFIGCNNKEYKVEYYPTGEIMNEYVVINNDTIKKIYYDTSGNKIEEYFYEYDNVHPFGLTYKYQSYYKDGNFHIVQFLKNFNRIKELQYSRDEKLTELIYFVNNIAYLNTLYHYNGDKLYKITLYKRKKDSIFSPMATIKLKNNIIDTCNSFGYIIMAKDTIKKNTEYYTIENNDTILINQKYNLKIKILNYSFINYSINEIIVGKINDTSFNFVDTLYWERKEDSEFNITIHGDFDIGYNYITGIIKSVSADSSEQVYYGEIRFMHDFWVSGDYESKDVSFDPPLPEINRKILIKE